jgi:hypothetical protein
MPRIVETNYGTKQSFAAKDIEESYEFHCKIGKHQILVKLMLIPKSSRQLTQYIDAEAIFTALEQAKRASRPYVGSMFWREVKGYKYLIRAVLPDQQKSLGAMTPQNADAVDKFNRGKTEAEARVKSLSAELATHQKINKALRIGRAPDIVISTLNAIKDAGLEKHFLVIGTHALIAYETAAGVMISSNLMATQDIDLLFDTRKRVKFFTQMQRLDASFLSILQTVDNSFRMRDDQLYTAVNDKGFEVDVVRRMARDIDPHPLKLTDHEDDFWAVQIPTGEKLLGARLFEQVVASSTGTMARMTTVHPLDFARIKKALSEDPKREAIKSAKDLLQAKCVQELVREYLPHLMDEQARSSVAELMPQANAMTVTDGRYSGMVLQVSNGVVTQRTNRDGTTVQHSQVSLSKPVVVGAVVNIDYADGVGIVDCGDLSPVKER